MIAIAKWHISGQDVDFAFSDGSARVAALVQGVSMITHVVQIGMRVEDVRVDSGKVTKGVTKIQEGSDEEQRRK
jgi:hypothetical protein